MDSEFYEKVESNPIIVAINDLSRLDAAIESPSDIIFLLKGSIINLKETVDKIKNKGKDVYIHIDLIEGLSRDAIALEYIYKNIKPSGIISTKASLIKLAKEKGIFAIQRLFVIDSLSLETGLKVIKKTKPHAIEVLPGIMPKIVKRIKEETNIPVIAGGLICDKEDVIISLKAGAVAVSTSSEAVWIL